MTFRGNEDARRVLRALPDQHASSGDRFMIFQNHRRWWLVFQGQFRTPDRHMRRGRNPDPDAASFDSVNLHNDVRADVDGFAGLARDDQHDSILEWVRESLVPKTGLSLRASGGPKREIAIT